MYTHEKPMPKKNEKKSVSPHNDVVQCYHQYKPDDPKVWNAPFDVDLSVSDDERLAVMNESTCESKTAWASPILIANAQAALNAQNSILTLSAGASEIKKLDSSVTPLNIINVDFVQQFGPMVNFFEREEVYSDDFELISPAIPYEDILKTYDVDFTVGADSLRNILENFFSALNSYLRMRNTRLPNGSLRNDTVDRAIHQTLAIASENLKFALNSFVRTAVFAEQTKEYKDIILELNRKLVHKDFMLSKGLVPDCGRGAGQIIGIERSQMNYDAPANEAANPNVGQALQIKNLEPVATGDNWNYHYGAVVLKSAGDYVTLETHRGTDRNNWNFRMFGTQTPAQSFHQKHGDTGKFSPNFSTQVAKP